MNIYDMMTISTLFPKAFRCFRRFSGHLLVLVAPLEPAEGGRSGRGQHSALEPVEEAPNWA